VRFNNASECLRIGKTSNANEKRNAIFMHVHRQSQVCKLKATSTEMMFHGVLFPRASPGRDTNPSHSKGAIHVKSGRGASPLRPTAGKIATRR